MLYYYYDYGIFKKNDYILNFFFYVGIDLI